MKAVVLLVGTITAAAMFLPGCLSLLNAQSSRSVHPSTCDAPDRLLARLEREYGELQIGTGRNAVGERTILTAARNGSWTIITIGGSTACITAAGEGWRWSQNARGRDL